MRWDIQLQFQYGFYYAGAFVTVVWIMVLSQLPSANLSLVLPAFIFLGMNITTYYFIAGLILFEKGEGVLEALIVTPMRTWEYLASKAATLTLLAMLESLIIVILTYGFGFQPLFLILGMGFLGAIYTFIGFMAIARYDSINEYLMPSILFMLVLQLPVIDYFGLWQSWLFYLHPIQAPLMLIKAAFQTVEPWQIVYGLLCSLVWVGLTYRWARAAFHSFIIRKEGVRL
jgi:fluoroquinolone transport system permease protein